MIIIYDHCYRQLKRQEILVFLTFDLQKLVSISQHLDLHSGFQVQRKMELVRRRRKGGRRARREPLFHLRATQFLVLQKQRAHHVLQGSNQLWLAGLKQRLMRRASQGVLPHPWTSASSCHTYPRVSQNTGLNNPDQPGTLNFGLAG